jgi:hypothetical protein
MMGANDAAQNKKDDKRRAAFEKRQKSTTRGSHGQVADWAGADGDQLLRTVAAVTRTGDAIRLGYTRDGGAYSVALLHNGENHTDYISPTEDINEYLKGLEDDYKE